MIVYKSRVLDCQGLLQWDDQPKGDVIIGTLKDRPISISLLQLEDTSRRAGDGCLLAEMIISKGLCQPPMVHNTIVPEPDKMIVSRSTVNNTCQLQFPVVLQDYPCQVPSQQDMI